MRSVETASTMSRALNGGSSFWLEVVEVRVEEEEEVAVFRGVLRSWEEGEDEWVSKVLHGGNKTGEVMV
jgi:hypothetical protein